VWTHVLELVDKTLSVKLSITYLPALALSVTPEIHLDTVKQFHLKNVSFWCCSIFIFRLIIDDCIAQEEPPRNPCQPSPCGPNSQCREVNGQAVCSCLPTYIGSPPGCRPECTVSSECPQNRACVNQKCVDPCPGTCGINAQCSVINHSPICSCTTGFTGDPFTRCFAIPRKIICLISINKSKAILNLF